MRYMVLRAKPAAVIACCLALCFCVAFFARGNNAAPTGAESRQYPIYSVETEEKKVALGINCAWDNTDIPVLLQVLREHNVKATFFVSGSWCDKYPDSVRQLEEAGHEVGSHSNTHTDLTTLDKEGIQKEVRRSSEKIQALTGKAPTLFRTPSGAYNDLVIGTIKNEGLIPIQWDCDSVDYQEQSPDAMRERVLGKMRAGSIFLFHSGGKNTAAALPGIIEEIKAQGYALVTVSELIYPGPYTVDFEGRQHPA